MNAVDAPFANSQPHEQSIASQSLGSQDALSSEFVGFNTTSFQGNSSDDSVHGMGQDDVETGVLQIIGLVPEHMLAYSNKANRKLLVINYLHGRPSEHLQQPVLFRNSRNVHLVCKPSTVIQSEVLQTLQSSMFKGFVLVLHAQRRNLCFVISWVLNKKQRCL